MVGSAAIKQGRSANRKHTYFFFWPYNMFWLRNKKIKCSLHTLN